jgi:GxxExxY protein
MTRLAGSGNQRRPFEGKHAALSEKIIKVFYEVHKELGFGFSEKVYQNALVLALRDEGLQVEDQVPIKVYFRGWLVGEFFADVLVDGLILLELKSTAGIFEEHEAQLLNYLRATGVEVGYVLNFGKSAVFKRKIFDNDRKPSLPRRAH